MTTVQQMQSVARNTGVQIKFGTDGWRAIIAEDFTFANARTRRECHRPLRDSRRRRAQRVIIGYDHRFASDTVAAAVADVITASGTPVWLTDKPCPTPAVSLLVRQRHAAGGIVITASHNPYRWNGIKYKASYGSSALPSIVAQIEQELDAATHRDHATASAAQRSTAHPRPSRPLPRCPRKARRLGSLAKSKFPFRL